MAQGSFRGQVVDLQVNGDYVDFKLGQEQYERPVLCSARRADFPGSVKDGDFVVITGRTEARISKAGNAWERLRVSEVEIDHSAGSLREVV